MPNIRSSTDLRNGCNETSNFCHEPVSRYLSRAILSEPAKADLIEIDDYISAELAAPVGCSKRKRGIVV